MLTSAVYTWFALSDTGAMSDVVGVNYPFFVSEDVRKSRYEASVNTHQNDCFALLRALHSSHH